MTERTIVITLVVSDVGPVGTTAAEALAVSAMRAVYRAWYRGPTNVGVGVSLNVSLDGKDVTPRANWAGTRQEGDP